MTEERAVELAMALMSQQGMQHSGVDKSVFVPHDHPMNEFLGYREDTWMIFIKFPSSLIVPNIDLSVFEVEVNCETEKAVLRRSM
jgi:hypothetical protein